MKKCLLGLALLFAVDFCFSQYREPGDSLIKFSYFLQSYADSSMSIRQGTGFIVNNGNGQELITAKHVLSGCRFNGTKDSTIQDEMLMYLNEDVHPNFSFYGLNLRRVKDTVNCQQYYDAPDIISYPLEDTVADVANSIDAFLPGYFPRDRGEIIIFGFPSYNNIDSGKYFVRPAVKLEIQQYDFYDRYMYQDLGGSLIIDSINYTIKPVDMLVTDRLRGYSGAPVFIKDVQEASWVFLGVVIALDEKNNLLTIVKRENLLKTIGYR
jgi:hypothetical protein